MQKDFIVKDIRTAAILTNSYVAGTVIDTGGDYNQMVINAAFTIGSLTSASIKVEFSNDNSTYYQESNSSGSGAILTETATVHLLPATNNYAIPIPLLYRHIKISAIGTGTVTNSSLGITINLGVI